MATLRESLLEADEQIERRGVVWETLRRIVSELDRLGIPYAVVGGLALQHFGIGRSTQDVDLLVEQSSLERLHKSLVGRGYTLKSPTSRHIRDDISRVRVEFLIAGEFPGDGKPKPVTFSNPAEVSELAADGIAFVNLRTLIEMKLASAKSAAHRIKDRADVLELIHVCGLSAAYADHLSPYVRNEFLDLAALPPPTQPD